MKISIRVCLAFYLLVLISPFIIKGSFSQGLGCTSLLTFDDLQCEGTGVDVVPSDYKDMDISSFSCINGLNSSFEGYNNTGFTQYVTSPNLAYSNQNVTISRKDGNTFSFVDGCFGDVYMKNGTLITIHGFDDLNNIVKQLSFVGDCTEPRWVVANWHNISKIVIEIGDYDSTGNSEFCGGTVVRQNYLTVDNLCVGGVPQNNPCLPSTTVKGDAPTMTTQYLTTNYLTSNRLTTGRAIVTSGNVEEAPEVFDKQKEKKEERKMTAIRGVFITLGVFIAGVLLIILSIYLKTKRFVYSDK